MAAGWAKARWRQDGRDRQIKGRDMSETVYNDPDQYKGKEWNELLQVFNKRDLKTSVKGAYRKVGGEVLKVARQKLMQSGIANASKLKKDIRLRVYPKGGGFMITVKPHGKQGYHVNRFGLQKPVLMWAEEGTKVRYVRKGGGQVAQLGDGKWRTLGRRRGQMPAYHFLDGVEAEGAPIIERDIGARLEETVLKRAKKMGY